MILRIEDSESIAHFVAKNELLYQSGITPEEVYQQMEAVTLDEVNHIARQILKILLKKDWP